MGKMEAHNVLIMEARETLMPRLLSFRCATVVIAISPQSNSHLKL